MKLPQCLILMLLIHCSGAVFAEGKYKLTMGLAFSDVCHAMERNLNSVKPVLPMRCGFVIAPGNPDFTRPQWTRLDLEKNLDLHDQMSTVSSINYVKKKLKEVHEGTFDKKMLPVMSSVAVRYSNEAELRGLIKVENYKQIIFGSSCIGYENHTPLRNGESRYGAICPWDQEGRKVCRNVDVQIPSSYTGPQFFDVVLYEGVAYLIRWGTVVDFEAKDKQSNEGLMVRGVLPHRPTSSSLICFFEYVPGKERDK